MWIYTVHYQYVGFLHVCWEIVNHKFEVLMFQNLWTIMWVILDQMKQFNDKKSSEIRVKKYTGYIHVMESSS